MSATSMSAITAPQVSSISHNPDRNAHPKQPPHLELHIRTNRVGLYPQSPASITTDALAHSAMMTGPPNTTPPSDFTCLLSGPLDNFLLYSGREQSQWLIDLAHDICDPSLKRGSLRVWDAAGQMWSNVIGTDTLTASTYLYDVQAVISLLKISAREGKSKTSAIGNARTMAKSVKQRDEEECWVTGITVPTTNSHVCPKRMGDHLLRVVYDTFVSTPPPTLSIHDEICGITLSPTLDALFDTYELGLRFVAPDVYECHAFVPARLEQQEGWKMTLYGGGVHVHATTPALHGYRISPPRPQHPHNPPPGLIRWHYLQCVIRKYAHSEYRNLQNIYYFELPLRMDSDDEGTDSEYEYEWPSAALDRGRAMQAEIEQSEGRQRLQ